MKTSPASPLKSRLLITALGLFAFAVVAHAEDYVRYKAKPIGSTVRIDGVANIHEWSMVSSLTGGYLEVPTGVTLDSTKADVAGAPADGKIPIRAEVRMPVSSFKNGHWEGMDEVMQEAMGAKDFEAIEYKLTSITLKTPHAAGTPFQFEAVGDLTIHGVTKTITMPVTIETVDKTKLKVVGAGIPINMPDYGIKPPVKAAIFTTEPGVKISFEWLVGLPNKPSPAK